MVSEENKKPRKTGCLPSGTDSLNKKMLEREQATELENFKRESERVLKDTIVYWGYEQSPKPKHS